jgi:hypothetical protein
VMCARRDGRGRGNRPPATPLCYSSASFGNFSLGLSHQVRVRAKKAFQNGRPPAFPPQVPSEQGSLRPRQLYLLALRGPVRAAHGPPPPPPPPPPPSSPGNKMLNQRTLVAVATFLAACSFVENLPTAEAGWHAAPPPPHPPSPACGRTKRVTHDHECNGFGKACTIELREGLSNTVSHTRTVSWYHTPSMLLFLEPRPVSVVFSFPLQCLHYECWRYRATLDVSFHRRTLSSLIRK